jgi:lysophospholipase L1-like esterase
MVRIEGETFQERNMHGKVVMLIAVGLGLSLPAKAQLVDNSTYQPPKAGCCLASQAKRFAEQLQDWNQLGRYHEANEELKKQPAEPKRVVFMGDSITDGWKLAESFPGKPYVNRGISGQTTEQMLVRMYPDVIDLKPAAVIVLAGTNDIAQNTGPETVTMVQENLMAMTELAQKHGIKVILCSLTPISDYASLPVGWGDPPQTADGPKRKLIQSTHRPPSQVVQLNEWIRSYAASIGAIYADYFSMVSDANGMLKEELSDDGLHPNAKGYALMTPVAAAAIEKAMK